jgi:hypothetical protein
MQKADYANAVQEANENSQSLAADNLIKKLKYVEFLIFEEKDTIKPIKLYQIQRIYKLAKAFIEIITIIYPYIKIIISSIKK